MIKRKALVCVLVLIGLVLAGKFLAKSHRLELAGEPTFLQHLAIAIEFYAREHGRPPATWLEIKEHCNLDELNPRYLRGLSPIQARYVFVTNNLAGERGNIVLIRNRPYTNRGWQTGRHYISWNGAGVSVQWTNEKDIQVMLKKAGIIFPKVDADEVRRAEKLLREHEQLYK